MLNIELIWVKECPQCKETHCRTKNVRIARAELIDAADAEFEQHCEAWFENHLQSFNRDANRQTDRAVPSGGLLGRLLGTHA